MDDMAQVRTFLSALHGAQLLIGTADNLWTQANTLRLHYDVFRIVILHISMQQQAARHPSP